MKGKGIMIRKILLLCLLIVGGVFACACTGNTETEETGGETGAWETVEKETDSDETDAVGEETMTLFNELPTPCIVPTVYPTDDIVIADIIATQAPYCADPTGQSDATEAIRQALNDCAAQGGGTVFLPVGVYLITDTVQIPPFVTLRGDWQDPDGGTDYGTVIKACPPSSDNDETGLFLLGGSGGAVGLTVYYPEQGVGDECKPYPFTFYTNGVGTNYMLSTVKNVTVLNGYRGIGACCTDGGAAHEQLTVENFKGTFLLCGAEVYNQADVGTWQGVSVSPKFWMEIPEDSWMTAPSDDEIQAFIAQSATGLILGDLEWTEFIDLQIEGCKTGIHIVKGKRIEFAGSLYDISVTDCGQGIVIDSMDERWGMLIAKGVVEGGIVNNTAGLVRMTDVKVTGEIMPDPAGIAINNTVELAFDSLDLGRTYQKPNSELYVFDGTGDGSADVSESVQKLLDEAGKTGGVVYLPAGMYRLDAPISVPGGVELRGASSVANRDQGGLSAGTVILAYYGDGAEFSHEDRALITLEGENAGLNGLRIAYPQNGPYDEDLSTTYAVRGTAKGIYMTNCAVIAAAYGVDFGGCDGHFIEKVSTCCYYNAYLLGGRNGFLSGCLQNGTVLVRHGNGAYENWLSEANVFTDLFNLHTRFECDYIIVDGAENQTVLNTFIYGGASFLINRASENTLLINVGSDNLGEGMAQLMHEDGSMTAVNVMRWNGVSYEYGEGSLKLMNRLTIGDKTEENLNLN